MWSKSPVDWTPVLNGAVSEKSCRYYTSKPGDYERWLNACSKSPTADQILQSTEASTEFFSIESDLGRLIPQNEWHDAFYSLKMGFSVPGVPMMFLYFAHRLFDLYSVCNLVAPTFPKELAYYMDKKGFFPGQYTPLDALRTYVHEEFELLTEETPIADCGDWCELWLPKEQMVAAVPKCIGTQLSKADCYNIRVRPGVGLVLNDVPLVSLGGLKGVSASVFDLRGAI